VRYGCFKTTRCIEDNIKIGKQGSTWDNGDTKIMPHGTTPN
jgi:hypothetical protein